LIELIAETAWHHEGDFKFMENLIYDLCDNSKAHYIKLHITLDLDEYMDPSHPAYTLLKGWMFDEDQWSKLITVVQNSEKKLMLLLNDTKAINFAAKFSPSIVELHSVCLNNPFLQSEIKQKISIESQVVIGVGGCSVDEVEAAVSAFQDRTSVLMFGFQNYPTNYKDINLKKILKMQELFPDCLYGYADHTGWDETNNELVTLLVAANKMSFVEKHVTSLYGEERCDYNAAVSIVMFNQLAEKLKILESLKGNGTLEINDAEKKYSEFGPMKMAGIAAKDLKKAEILALEDIKLKRVSEITDLSQLKMLAKVGSRIKRDILTGHVFCAEDFQD
jgi:N,N'-diacetyllegionaminate synthase